MDTPGTDTSRTPPKQAVPPRVLVVPLIAVGSLIALLAAAVPGFLRERPAATATAVLVAASGLLLTVVVRRRDLDRPLLLVLLVWVDLSTAALGLQAGSTGSNVSLVVLTLPGVFAALYGGRRILLVQLAVALALAGVVQAAAGSWGVVLVLDLVVFLYVTGGQAGAVLLLREWLLRHAARDRRLALTDPLTLVANRRGLEHAVPGLVARASRERRPLGVVVLDVDHFKQVNDRHGHAMGDLVLRQVAGTLAAAVGPDDLVVRLGGEEFAVLTVLEPLEPLEPLELAALAERLRAQVAETGGAFGVTASAGVAWDAAGLTGPEPVQAAWTLVDRADGLMYDAKRSGRDRVRVDRS